MGVLMVCYILLHPSPCFVLVFGIDANVVFLCRQESQAGGGDAEEGIL